MAQTVTEELALIIKAQTKEATEALNEYEENVKNATGSMAEAGTAADKTSQATSKGAEANKKATETEISKASAVDKSYNSYMKLVGAYAAVAIVVAKGIRLYKDFAAEGEVNVLAAAKLEGCLQGPQARRLISPLTRLNVGPLVYARQQVLQKPILSA